MLNDFLGRNSTGIINQGGIIVPPRGTPFRLTSWRLGNSVMVLKVDNDGDWVGFVG